MAKFCGNCGARMDDAAKICGNCGTAFETVSVSVISSEQNFPKSNLAVKKYLKIAFSVVVLVVIAVVGFNIASAFTGYKGAIRKTVNAFEDYDMETLISMASELNYYANDEETIENHFNEKVEERLDYYEDKVGANLKISYEIASETDYSERKIENFLENYNNENLDWSEVKQIKKVSLNLTVKGSDEEINSDVDSLYLIKENGNWKILYIQ